MPKKNILSDIGSVDCVSNVNVDNCSISVNPASVFAEADRSRDPYHNQTYSDNPTRRYSDNHNRQHPNHNKPRVQFARNVESGQEVPSMFAAADRVDPNEFNRVNSDTESGDYIRKRGNYNDDVDDDSEDTESDVCVLFDTNQDSSQNRTADHRREENITQNHSEKALGKTTSRIRQSVTNVRSLTRFQSNLSLHRRRSSIWVDGIRSLPEGKKKKKKQLHNTYQLEPKEDFRFNFCVVKAIMDQVTDNCLLEMPSYDPFVAGKLIKKITGGIVNRTKIREYDRLKIVCHVTLMELTGQCGMVASRHLWGDETDKVITINRSKRGDKGQFECIVTVYGMYYE